MLVLTGEEIVECASGLWNRRKIFEFRQGRPAPFDSLNEIYVLGHHHRGPL